MKQRSILLFGYRGGILALCLVLLLTLVACSTTWIVDLETYLPVAIGGVAGILTILVSAGALGPVIPVEIATIATAVTNGLSLLCGTPVNNQCNPTSLIGIYNVTPGNTLLQKIQAELAGLQANLTALLNLVHIKNTVLQATISAAISLIITTVAAIAARITRVANAMLAAGTKAAARAAATLPKMPISVGQFKAQLNQFFTSAGYPNATIS